MTEFINRETEVDLLAWDLYCENTWTGVAKDFFVDLSVREKLFWRSEAEKLLTSRNKSV